MSRRKGERPVNHPVLPWSAAHPVALDMEGDTRWLDAWTGQTGTGWATLAKVSGISVERIEQLQSGSQPTEGELAGLAKAWRTTPEIVAASIASVADVLQFQHCASSVEMHAARNRPNPAVDTRGRLVAS